EGVIEFYKARTDTKMTIAAERLTLIAVLTLPITALSSVYGMNIIVNDRTDFPHLAVVLAAMLVISAVLLRWAKRQEWWEQLPGRPGRAPDFDLVLSASQLALRRRSHRPSSGRRRHAGTARQPRSATA